MTAETNACLLKQNDSIKDRIEVAGLEGLFEGDRQELFSTGLSIRQAVFYYGETRQSIKAKVLEGSIPAIRLPKAYGRKWKIFPAGVPPQLQDLIPKKHKAENKQEEQPLQPCEPQVKEQTNTEEQDVASSA